MKIKIVFFGTPDYSLPVLTALHRAFKNKSGSPIVAVVTQKPKPAGRQKQLTYSAVDQWAHLRQIPVFYQPDELIKNKIKAHLGVLSAFGQIISREVIDYFPQGILNIHPSLLPRWRGASPVAASIVAGETETGVTIIKLDEKLDHGPIVAQFKESIAKNDTTGSLRQRLFEKSASVLTSLLPAYLANKITPRPQNHQKATFTTQIKKEDGFIKPVFLTAALEGKTAKKSWSLKFMSNYQIRPTPQVIERFVRAMYPWPIGWTHVNVNKKQKTKNKKRLKILKARTEGEKLILEKVQLEGKRSVSWTQFKQGYPNFIFE